MNVQYLDSKDLAPLDSKVEITLVATDTYHEKKLLEKVLKMNKNVLFGIALHVAIIGIGGKTYGQVKVEEQYVDLKEFMTKNNIKYTSTLNTKLEDDDITPRRLARLFRFQIKEYLQKNKHAQSYLHRKYVDPSLQTEETRCNIFQGSEHMLDPKKDVSIVKVLLKAYEKLDKDYNERHSTKISIKDRILRVLNARGFTSKDLL